MWTNQKPTEPGWYWARNHDSPSGVWEAVVRIDIEDNKLVCSWMCETGKIATLEEEHWEDSCLWSGPIEPPIVSQPIPLSVEARTAARWWADLLRCRESMSAEDYQRLNGDPSRMEVEMVAVVEKWQGLVKRPSDIQIDYFEQVLARLIQNQFVETEHWENSKNGPEHWGEALRTVGTDYGADTMLSMAYEAAAGISPVGVFPIKTMMRVSPGSVKVRVGYSGDLEEILAGRLKVSAP